MKSAFCGYIAEIPFILVDNFENKHKSAYFLSHFHGDHVFGLDKADLPTNLKKNEGYIYASEVTIAIIRNEVPELSPYLKILNLGKNTISIKEDDKELYLNITVLPAGHSLGSVMFLFEYNQTILYTGDFRITPDTLSKYTHLHKNGQPITLDVLYIDTTFQNVASFPKRSDVVRNLIVHVHDWLNTKCSNKVILLTSAMYGYECVCNEMYSALKIKTFIRGAKWNVFSQFPKEMYGITNDKSSRIHLCKKNENIYQDTPETLFIYFSAMKWAGQVTEDNYLKIKKNRIDVCFATHCGRDELLHFKNYFQPKRIVGFPEPFFSSSPVKIDCNQHLALSLLSPKKSGTKRPRSRSNSKNDDLVVDKRISKDLLQNMFGW